MTDDTDVKIQLAELKTDIKWIRASIENICKEHCEQQLKFDKLKERVDTNTTYIKITGGVAAVVGTALAAALLRVPWPWR